MNLLLAVTSNVLSDGFKTILLGITVVFLGMAIIVLFVTLFGFLFDKFVNKKASKPSKEPENLALKTVLDDGSIPENIKVAIIAAVTACYYNEESKKCDFTVKKIKR
ncbi:MAG: OadG family protein [Clostridia bacterium]|nr:OadG family protein [Clostridia bacterium]